MFLKQRASGYALLAILITWAFGLPTTNAQTFDLSNATDLVRARQVGRERHYRLHPKPLERVRDWLALYERFWTRKLDALGEHLRNQRETRTQV